MDAQRICLDFIFFFFPRKSFTNFYANLLYSLNRIYIKDYMIYGVATIKFDIQGIKNPFSISAMYNIVIIDFLVGYFMNLIECIFYVKTLV